MYISKKEKKEDKTIENWPVIGFCGLTKEIVQLITQKILGVAILSLEKETFELFE